MEATEEHNGARKSRSRRVLLAVLLGLFAILILGFIAPFVSANAFSRPIENALEVSLGRKVHFGDVHFTLFSGPGFSIDDVTIAEDSKYGLEPFAHATTLKARLRVDKLLIGHIAFAGFDLIEPSLNFVKRSDGTWNVLELVERLSALRSAPLNLFPAVDVSSARIDFKIGTRKTTLYIAGADLAIYPERSGKLRIQFSGSPARTDRAGNGFGHLRGTATWHLTNRRLDADVTLDRSNLSEMTTLFEGHDIGIHGTISSRARIDGPVSALQVSGELRLEDVHRWDLLPASGEDWRIRYTGSVDWLAHSFDLTTSPLRSAQPPPVIVETRVTDFLTHPAWSILARFDQAPAKGLLPLARRMGLAVPEQIVIQGNLAGAIGYSRTAGLQGGVLINDLVATLPNIPPLSAKAAKLEVSGDSVHFEPAPIQSSFPGSLQAGGEYSLSRREIIASLRASEFPVDALKSTADAWFGAPPALELLHAGTFSGQLVYRHEGTNAPAWSGQFQLSDSKITPPGVAIPLEHSEGRVSFDESNLELTRFSAMLGQDAIRGTYRYRASAKRPERIHLEFSSADLTTLESAFDPSLRAQDLLARLGVTRRSIPPWLAARNLEGDATFRKFSVHGNDLGQLSTRFVWQGPNIAFNSLQLHLPGGLLTARGSANLLSYSPRYHFVAKVDEFPWRDGVLNAEGTLETYGTGLQILLHLRASGTFSGEDLTLSANDVFSKLSGLFDFSFADGWPNLRLSNMQATDGEDAWNGEASSQSDGKLIFDFEHAGRQRRVVSTLIPQNSAVSSSGSILAAR